VITDDRTTSILEVMKVITKKNITLQFKENCSNVNIIVQHFLSRLEPLTNKGFPSIFVINDKLMPIEDYIHKLREVTTSATIVSNIKGTTTPSLVLNALRDTFFILIEVKHIFLVKPTFTKYTEMDEVYRRVINLSIPNENFWEQLTDLLN